MASLTRAASALRDRGNIWQGCCIAILLSEDEYVPRPLIHVRHITAQLAPKEAPHSQLPDGLGRRKRPCGDKRRGGCPNPISRRRRAIRFLSAATPERPFRVCRNSRRLRSRLSWAHPCPSHQWKGLKCPIPSGL